MSQTEHQQTTELAKEQSEAHHTLALTSEATPAAKHLLEHLQALGRDAEEGDGDLGKLADQLEEAERTFHGLKKRAEYLDMNRPD